MNRTLTILPEIENLLPPLSYDEMSGIESDILQRGVIAPLVVWNNVLVDGHHRYKVCKKHSLPFAVRELEFDSLQSAKLWAWQHQENRRNLTPFQRAEMSLRFKPQIAERAKERQRMAGGYRKSEQTKPLPPMSEKTVNTRNELAAIAGVSHDTLTRAEYIVEHADEGTKTKLRIGDTTINAEYKRLKKEAELVKTRDNIKAQTRNSVQGNPPTIYPGDGIQWLEQQEPCDLLLTDPPYSTDVPNIEAFANYWLPAALAKVKPTGFAYIFIGAYLKEIAAYINIEPPEHMQSEQMLVWSYKNTLGNNPKDRYKQNWQAVLFYRGKEAPPLDCPLTSEQWAVIEANAPDGRLGNRFHAWQKPLELAERFIRHSTRAGDTVLDPFACTGTFLLAANKLGRIGKGAEINPDNAAIAIERGCMYA